MISFAGRGLLLDIEGTLSPLSFTHQVLFPYARRELTAFLRAHWDRPDVIRARERIARDAGAASFAAWCAAALPGVEPLGLVRAKVLLLMDRDVKATGLKELQGLIWEGGYRRGELRSPVFADVPPALTAWRRAGRTLAIFSSGSIAAQQLFLGHTDAGDLTGCFRGFFDTTVGPKRSSASYTAIARSLRLPPADLLFLSDVPAELDAAAAAGLSTGLMVRPGNPPQPATVHPVLTTFAQVCLAG